MEEDGVDPIGRFIFWVAVIFTMLIFGNLSIMMSVSTYRFIFN